jgi:predicted permease
VVGSSAAIPDARLAAVATTTLRHDGMAFDTAAHARVEALAGADNEFASREMSIAARLAGVALILLLISCANIANLLLARGLHRRRELMVRIALGVSRSRLVGLLLVESLSVAALGALVAIAVAYRGADVLRRMLLPDVHWVDATVNPTVLLFAVAAAVLVGLLAGIVPAWQLSRPDVSGFLRTRTDAPIDRHRARGALLLVQTALSVLLLAAAGFFVRSLVRVSHADTGYGVDRIVQVDVDADRAHLASQDALRARLPGIAAELAGIPGVERAAVADMAPMWGIHFENWYVPGRDTTSMFGSDGPYASFVGPGYFETVGMRVLRGHGFTDAVRGAAGVVVNAEMARKVWPGRDPLTQCIRIESATAACRPVLGVVSDTHADGLIDESPSMHFYLPAADTGGVWHAGVILLRAAPGMTASTAMVVARRLDAEFGSWAEVRVHPMSENFARELHPWRVGTALFTVAGVLSLIVAMIGIYGTVAYTMSQRTREIGVRMALGAASGGVIRLVIRQGVSLVAIGIGVGVGITLALGRLIDSMLYHTSAHDPVVLAAVSVTLLFVAALACLIPAWRALRVDPVVALRAD